MNKEVPLKERIEKLYESGYVNEFNYLENQLQEARYLVTILHKQTKEKDKEIEGLKAREQECIDKYLVESKYRSEIEGKYVVDEYIINELEKWAKENNVNNRDIYGYEMEDTKVIYLEDFLDKLKELKELKEGK